MSVRREGMPEVDETPKVKVLQEVDRPRLLIWPRSSEEEHAPVKRDVEIS